MQDYTAVPALIDLATMREAVARLGGDPAQVRPVVPVDLVVDHSVVAEAFGRPDAARRNLLTEYRRNGERYRFLRWAQQTIDGLTVVPPGSGIVHQVSVERLARVVSTRGTWAMPDTVIGTDSHTTMVNGLGILGWGVGGIEAEAVLLGQPVTMRLPRVVGVRITGTTQPGVTATDVVLTLSQRLREHGVVGAFVEFGGAGLASLSAADRATIANMAPEFGSTCAYFPVDAETLRYLRLTGRDDRHVALVESYAKEQGLWAEADLTADYAEVLTVDLAEVVPSISGPRRPQERVALTEAHRHFHATLPTFRPGRDTDPAGAAAAGSATNRSASAARPLTDGAVALAAITSCTNTSNPAVMIAAGLLARNAVARGLTVPPWVKTTLAPGSRAVAEYLRRAGLTEGLERLGFHIVGFGCTTCIGNSGELTDAARAAVRDSDVVLASVLSGNRNFEGRVHPDTAMNYLASPPLVVAYALAGTMDIDLTTQPLGTTPDGTAVHLREIWPPDAEIRAAVAELVDASVFQSAYRGVFDGDAHWRDLEAPTGATFDWDPDSTYVRRPPYLDDVRPEPEPVTDIVGARVLVSLGDGVTTDHIAPSGVIHPDSPAGRYLIEHGTSPAEFNSHGSRRGNHEVMVRSTFGNPRLRNRLAAGRVGGFTRYLHDDPSADPSADEVLTIYESACRYQAAGVPLVVLAGREYGTGSSRDWAAKGTALLGVRAVLAESFERIHRGNLIGMGVLPLEFPPGQTAAGLGLTGLERFTITGIEQACVGESATVTVHADDISFSARVRIDTPAEALQYRHGGVLRQVLRSLGAGSPTAAAAMVDEKSRV